MTKFKKGDRVRVVEVTEYAAECGIKDGDEGTVVGFHTAIAVRMDNYNKYLHDCFSLCKDGHGWWFEKHQLQLIENETPEPLENWKHPYYGKPILVRDNENEGWIEATFVSYTEGLNWPIVTSDENGDTCTYKYYKFPDPTPKVPEYTIEEAEKEFNIKIKKS